MEKETWLIYLSLIADSISSVYGANIKREGLDLKMAEKSLDAIGSFLYFHPSSFGEDDIECFKSWIDKRIKIFSREEKHNILTLADKLIVRGNKKLNNGYS